TSVVRNLAVVLFAGIANASQIIVGNSIGGGNREAAYQSAKKFLQITAVLGLATGIILILARYFFLLPYKASAETIEGAANVIFVYGSVLIFYVFNMVA